MPAEAKAEAPGRDEAKAVRVWTGPAWADALPEEVEPAKVLPAEPTPAQTDPAHAETLPLPDLGPTPPAEAPNLLDRGPTPPRRALDLLDRGPTPPPRAAADPSLLARAMILLASAISRRVERESRLEAGVSFSGEVETWSGRGGSSFGSEEQLAKARQTVVSSSKRQQIMMKEI